MDIADWTVAGWAALAFALMAAVTRSAGHRARSARRLGRAVGLEVPDRLRPAIEARYARRNRIVAAGAGLGVLGWVGLRLAGAESAEALGGLLLIAGSCFAGGALGAAAAAATDRRPMGDDAVRIARTRAVSVEDYLPPSELVGARGAVALSLVTTVVLLALGWVGVLEPTSLPIAPIAMVLLGVVSLVLFEVAAPRILDRGRPAGSELELAWDDALRATALREMITAPLCLGLWGGLTLLFGVGESEPGLAGDVATAAAMIGSLLVVVIGLATTLGRRPRQHYLRRLWPGAAAGDVMRTG